jgi:hypothetical protein
MACGRSAGVRHHLRLTTPTGDRTSVRRLAVSFRREATAGCWLSPFQLVTGIDARTSARTSSGVRWLVDTVAAATAV